MEVERAILEMCRYLTLALKGGRNRKDETKRIGERKADIMQSSAYQTPQRALPSALVAQRPLRQRTTRRPSQSYSIGSRKLLRFWRLLRYVLNLKPRFYPRSDCEGCLVQSAWVFWAAEDKTNRFFQKSDVDANEAAEVVIKTRTKELKYTGKGRCFLVSQSYEI